MEIFHNDWAEFLNPELKKPYYLELRKFLVDEYKTRQIFPDMYDIFNALHYTSYHDTKVVILGQDPYHNPHQAMGLSFSVPKGIPLPPSLKNIYKEITNDLGIPPSQNGDLSQWAKQGVLLLNSVLSVEHNKPASHQNFGWQTFTDNVIKTISNQKKGIVFLLWGNYAKAKKNLIDSSKHFILEAAHPSPLARSGFLGCRHFSQTNAILESRHKSPINWQIDYNPLSILLFFLDI